MHLVNKGIDKSPVRCDVKFFANITSMPNKIRRSQEKILQICANLWIKKFSTSKAQKNIRRSDLLRTFKLVVARPVNNVIIKGHGHFAALKF